MAVIAEFLVTRQPSTLSRLYRRTFSDPMTLAIFCDGGLVRENPSPHAGTWAFVTVVNGEVVEQQSGILTPSYFKQRTISNNDMEIWAVIRALESMEEDWSGTVYTDSNCTIMRFLRLQRGKPLSPKIPNEIVLRAEAALLRLKTVTFCHIKGHPVKADLRRGYTKRGKPVSKYQVLCDDLCTEEGTKFSDAFLSVRQSA